ncbi:MAG: hypothetical protein J6581_09540 [Apibacter sp.]|jgi:hypothetical protein|nr:hypothetical protein [Apibacter sp.]
MKKTKKLDVIKFEVLKTSGKVMKGGFSNSFSTKSLGGSEGFNIVCNVNCKGGKCSENSLQSNFE